MPADQDVARKTPLRWLRDPALAASAAFERRQGVAIGLTLLAALLVGMLGSYALSQNRERVGGWAHDFHAFYAAGSRWRGGEAMYFAELLEGPFPSVVGGAYLYPPTLALALTPAQAVKFDHAAIVWGGLQQLFLVGAALIAGRAGGARRLRILEAALLVALPLLFWPQMWLLKDGNVGGLLALLAALGLYRTRIGGVAVAAAAAIKLVAITAVPAAVLAGRRMATGLVAGLLVLGAMNLLLAPGDSIEFPRVMLNLAVGETNHPDNLALNQAFGILWGSEAVSVGRGVALGITAVLMLLSLIAAWQSRHRTAMSAAIWASLFLSATMWAHYLVIALVPLASAWASSGRAVRIVSVIAALSLAANLQLEPGPKHVLTAIVVAWLMVSALWVLWRSEQDEPRYSGLASRFAKDRVGPADVS